MRSLKTVLTFLSFCTKRFYTHKKAPKAQKGNQTKAQNANKRTKITNALKKHLGGGGSHLFAYLRFCACEQKSLQ